MHCPSYPSRCGFVGEWAEGVRPSWWAYDGGGAQLWLFIDTPPPYVGLHCTDPTGAGLRGEMLCWKAGKGSSCWGRRLWAEASCLQPTQPLFPARSPACPFCEQGKPWSLRCVPCARMCALALSSSRPTSSQGSLRCPAREGWEGCYSDAQPMGRVGPYSDLTTIYSSTT